MLETEQQWSMYGFTFPNYLAELGPNAQTDVAEPSSLDKAMRDAFRKLRRFLMTVHHMSEDEAIALMSVAADFGVTQVVDANWGVQIHPEECFYVHLKNCGPAAESAVPTLNCHNGGKTADRRVVACLLARALLRFGMSALAKP